MRARYVIGVDESGTGALAGPFTVCAFMSLDTDTDWISEEGARDSKQLTARMRYRLRERLAPCCICAETIVVPGDYDHQLKVKQRAIARAVQHCLEGADWDTSRVLLCVDGETDLTLVDYFWKVWHLRSQFIIRGDAQVPQISAASIFAKTRRSDVMRQLHAMYPMYGWSRGQYSGNDGYGTPDHFAAIEEYGICELHRRVKPLLRYFKDGKRQASRQSIPGICVRGRVVRSIQRLRA